MKRYCRYQDGKPPVTVPTIHLNGTSREAILDGIAATIRAIDRALDLLCQSAPNARDYYPQGPGAFEQAHREHAKRAERLRSVRDELQTIAESIGN